MPSPLKVLARFIAHEKGLFAGAILVAGIAAALGVPFDFVLFGLTLAGVALFHHHTLQVALTGLAVISLYKLAFTGFKTGPGLGGLAAHMGHEWVILTNLLGLLLGFALLVAALRGQRGARRCCRASCPTTGRARFVLLVMVFVLSSLPRQHRGGADRRRDGAHACSAARCTSAISRRSSPPRTPAARAAWSATPRPR